MFASAEGKACDVALTLTVRRQRLDAGSRRGESAKKEDACGTLPDKDVPRDPRAPLRCVRRSGDYDRRA